MSIHVGDIELEVLAFLACDSVVRDSATGKTSVQGIFDTINVQSIPAMFPSFAVYFRVKFDRPHDHVVTNLAIGTPNRLRQVTPDLPLLNIGPTGSTEGWINVQGMIFHDFGEHTLELLINGETVAKNFLIVQLVGGAPYGNKLN